MPQLPKPLNNNALVEIIDPYDGVARSGEGESQKKGKLVDVNIMGYHLTASSGQELSTEFITEFMQLYASLKEDDATVYWEEYANEGQTFTHEGKNYAFVAWWRLTGFELPEEVK